MLRNKGTYHCRACNETLAMWENSLNYQWSKTQDFHMCDECFEEALQMYDRLDIRMDIAVDNVIKQKRGQHCVGMVQIHKVQDMQDDLASEVQDGTVVFTSMEDHSERLSGYEYRKLEHEHNGEERVETKSFKENMELLRALQDTAILLGQWAWAKEITDTIQAEQRRVYKR